MVMHISAKTRDSDLLPLVEAGRAPDLIEPLVPALSLLLEIDSAPSSHSVITDLSDVSIVETRL